MKNTKQINIFFKLYKKSISLKTKTSRKKVKLDFF